MMALSRFCVVLMVVQQVDDKKSILVNYGNGAGDELRLINR